MAKHPIHEDLFALICAGLLVGLGVSLLKFEGLLAGGTAGLALVICNLLPVPFGLTFFVLNLPFFVLAIVAIGKRFAINTLIAVSGVSLFADFLHLLIDVQSVNAVFAAVAGGIMLGVGVLITFRHNASLGGVGILAYWLQDRHNIRAGHVQMALDCAIVLIGFFLVPLPVLAISILGAVVMNIVISLNHRAGRYQIT